MDPMPSSGDAPAASLVGSLASFRLADVLSLLAHTNQGGELQVVGGGVDGRVWIDQGELAGSAVSGAQTLTQAIFELALVQQGWFYFTEGRTAPYPGDRQSVASALEVVGPQVSEWHDLLDRVPLDSVVHLSPTPPGSDVQIRSEQWQILTTLGGSDMTVRDVVASLEHDQVVTLRLLRDLAEAGLVVVTTKDGQQSEAPESVSDEAASPPDAAEAAAPANPWPAFLPTSAPSSAPNTPFAPPFAGENGDDATDQSA
ncbi:MAG TPA: DUF4388 domain-containing protein, partial [Acidimicrobiales bacterium]|nr:DUF4388 domain-containing protein [Acidimicrobiales bacterium]